MPDADYPLVIEERPTGARARARAALRGRRVALAVALALVEVAAFLVWRPSVVLATLFGVLVLIGALWLASRTGPGLGRDLLLVVAGAQALVVAVPLIIGFSVLTAMLVALVLIAGVAVLVYAAIRR